MARLLSSQIMQHHKSINLKLDDRIDSYSSFFDHEWAKEINSIAERANRLDDFALDLMLTLKGISRAASIPQFAVDVAKHYAEGHGLERLDNSETFRLVAHIAERLGQKNVLTATQHSELLKTMLDLAEEVRNKVVGITVEFPRQELWDEMVKVSPGEGGSSPKNEVRIGIWSSQRNCYSSLFFAYEDFVVRCVHRQSGQNVWVSKTKEFNKLCRATLGNVLTDLCWSDTEIEIARKIRHALAHVGGRETERLKEVTHGIDVVDGRLQILPADVLNLFNLIKPRIKALVEWAAPLAAFS